MSDIFTTKSTKATKELIVLSSFFVAFAVNTVLSFKLMAFIII